MIGSLRHRVQVQAPQQTQDEFGEVAETWVTVAEVWAEVRAMSGRELFNAQQVQADVTHKVRMRYLDVLRPSYRLVHDGKILNVSSIVPDTLNTMMEVMCVEPVTSPVVHVMQTFGGTATGGSVGE